MDRLRILLGHVTVWIETKRQERLFAEWRHERLAARAIRKQALDGCCRI